MRKFKVKNRQKRKYVRKIVEEPGSSFARTIPIGLLPMLLIVLALIMNTFISTQAVDQSLSAITLPKISLPTIVLPQIYLTLPSPMRFILPLHTHKETFTGMLPIITTLFSSIDPTTTIQASNERLEVLSNSIWNLLIQSALVLVRGLQTLILELNSYLQSFAHLVIRTLIVMTTGIRWVAITTFMSIMQGPLTFGTSLINGLILIIHALQFLFHITMQALQISVSAIWWFSQIIFTATVHFFVLVGKTIEDAMKAFMYYLELPFKILWSYLSATKPFFIAFGTLITQSGNELVGGFKNLGIVTSELSKGQ